MSETEHDIKVYASWCDDGTADLYAECRFHNVVLYEGTDTYELTASVRKHLEDK
jgi:hypothetical protein